MTALEASKLLSISYSSVIKKYERYRKSLIGFLEAEYEKNRDNILAYDEFLYIDHNKRGNPKFIFDAYNFLTFDYGGRVYTIMMPSLTRFKSAFLEDGIDEIYYTNFYEFLNIHRISRLKSKENTIVEFWDFLDTHLKIYKGFREDNFIYYLKEAEFKFNYPDIKERLKILTYIYLY